MMTSLARHRFYLRTSNKQEPIMDLKQLEQELNDISYNYYHNHYYNTATAQSFFNDNKKYISKAIAYIQQYPQGVISLKYLCNDDFLKMINLFIQHGISVIQFDRYMDTAPNHHDDEKRVFIHYRINN